MLQRLLLHCLLAWIFAMSCFASQPARADDNKESLVKAAFMVNFIKFIEWPSDKSIPKQAKIDVCLFGDSNIINFSQVFKQASTQKLSISIVRENNIAAIPSHCHILFIGATDRGREITDALKSQPVLTVSDSPGFTEHGGMMGFVTDDGKIKLVVNKRAIETGGMYVDAQLLEIAFRVIDN